MISTSRGCRRAAVRAVCAGAMALSVGACQPAGDPAVLEAPEEAEEAGEEVASRPPVPAALDDLMAETDAIAAEWQDEVRPVEVLVHLTAEGEPRRARVTYLAAQADRFLTVEIGDGGPSEERHTLATLGLDPVDVEGLEAIPAVPDGAADADTLARSAVPVLEECGFDTTVDAVLYTSGAPTAWDGREWASELAWTATASSEGGNAVALDPVGGSPAEEPCVTPPEGA